MESGGTIKYFHSIQYVWFNIDLSQKPINLYNEQWKVLFTKLCAHKQARAIFLTEFIFNKFALAFNCCINLGAEKVMKKAYLIKLDLQRGFSLL